MDTRKNNNKKQVLFILNPVAGNTSPDEVTALIDQYKDQYGYTPSYYKTTGKNDEQKIKKEIDSLMPDMVVVAGGDGTVQMVSGLIDKQSVKLGILPTGSANGLAFECNIPMNLEQAFPVLFEGSVQAIDRIKINGNNCLHLSDIGINARIIKRFEKDQIRGFPGYVRHFFKEFNNQISFRCRIQTSTKKITRKAVMVVIANARRYRTGAVINPVGELSDGEFEIVLIKPYPWYHFFKLFFALFAGTLNKTRYVKIISTDQATLTPYPRQELQVDGELTNYGKDIKVSIEPRVISIISGK